MCANISELSIESKINTTRNEGPVDLNNKSLLELQDLLDRQDAILKNKKFVKLLPDKGEKILKLRTKIENEITHRKEIDQASKLISCLNISGDKKLVEELEWKRNHRNHLTLDDVEKDETDVLKILSESAGLGSCKKKNNSTIELHEDTDGTEASNYSEYTKKLIKKTANENQSPLKKEPFKPHKSVKNENINKKHDSGINQSSNPNKAIKLLDLNDSIKVEEEYNGKIQEIKMQHALERLGVNNTVHLSDGLADTRNDDSCSLNEEVESIENLSEDEQDFEHENNHDY